MILMMVLILSAALAGLSAISLVKNFLVSFNVSDSGWKTAMIVVLIVICLLCAVISYSEGFTIQDINNLKSSGDISQEELDQLSSLIPIKTITIIVSLCIGYISYFLQLLFIKNIKKNKLKEIEARTDDGWKDVLS